MRKEGEKGKGAGRSWGVGPQCWNIGHFRVDISQKASSQLRMFTSQPYLPIPARNAVLQLAARK